MNINWRAAVTQFLLRTGFIGIGLGLIGAGTGLVAGDILWEIALEKFLDILLPGTSDSTILYYRIGASVALILLGLGVIAFWFRVEALRTFVRFKLLEYHLVIGEYHGNISHEEWEGLQNPSFEFQVEFEVQTGNRTVTIHAMSIERLINGKSCWATTTVVKEEVPGAYWKNQPNAAGVFAVYHEPHNDYVTYDTVKVEAVQTRRFLFKRKAKGPNPHLMGYDITYGKGHYNLHVEYSFEGSQKRYKEVLFGEEDAASNKILLK